MFDKLKQINELRKLQGEFAKEKVTIEKQGVAVTINGNFEVEDIKLSATLGVQDQQNALKSALNEARQEIQKKLAGKMAGMGF